MKKLILAAALLTSSVIAFATSNNVNLAEGNIAATIKSQIRFPDYLTDREGEYSAAIFFKVSDCGTIIVQDIQTDDQDLKADLLNQMADIKVNTIGLHTRDVYKVVVRFETL